jgi:hypothetical protein
VVEKVGIVSAKLFTAQCTFCVQNTKHKQKQSSRASCTGRKVVDIKVQNTTEPSSGELQRPETQPAPRGLNRTPHADCSGISANTNWTKLLLVGTARRSIQQYSVKDVRNTRSEVKLRTFVNSAFFRFTKVLFCEMPLTEELLEPLCAVSSVLGSGVSSIPSIRN